MDDPGRQTTSTDELASELFHELSQPLTALQCGLELALQSSSTMQELRAAVEAALTESERLRQRLLLLRALNNATHPPDASSSMEVRVLILEICETLRPLYNAADQRLECLLCENPVFAYGDSATFATAIFHFLEAVLAASKPATVTMVSLRTFEVGRAELTISTQATFPRSASHHGVPVPHSCAIELLHRTFRAVKGNFECTSSHDGKQIWRGVFNILSVSNS